MKKTKVAPAKPTSPAFPITVETFSNPLWRLQDMSSGGKVPYCWNQEVGIHRYRITAEIVEEPLDVLAERLRKLWRECSNMHHFGPLRAAAEKLGVELDSAELGRDRK